MDNNENTIQNQTNEAKTEKKKSKGGFLKVFIIIVLLIMFLGIGLGAGVLISTEKWTPFKKQENATNNTTQISAENIEISYTTRIVKKITEGENSTYICREELPEIKGLDEKAINKIEDYLSKWREDVWQDIDEQNSEKDIKEILSGAGENYENYEIGFSITYKVLYLNDKVITIGQFFDGGIGGVSWAKNSAVSFDLATGEVIEISDIVTSKEDYIKACEKNVLEQLKADSRYEDVVISRKDYEEIISENIEHLGGYFTSKGIMCVQIPRYVIASGAAGQFEYEVPYDVIKDFIKSDYNFSNIENKADKIKETRIDNTKTKGTVNKTEESNSEYNKAIGEIKKCLKDENWLKENGLMESFEPYDEYSVMKQYFGKLQTVNNKPYFVLRTHILDADYIYIISYDGEKVTLSNKCGADYGDVLFDFNNQIAKIDGSIFVAYYKVTNNHFEFLGQVDRSDEHAAEFEALEQKYKDYSFKSIETELTEANIEEYVK